MKKAKKVPAKRRSAGPTKKKKVLKKGRVGYAMVAKKPFRLKVGKFYESRLGQVVGPLIKTESWRLFSKSHPYTAAAVAWTYRKDGGYEGEGETSALDLVREVPAPKPPKRGKA